ncbi:hypothetical protein BZZ01_03785 [Nostocales cyanobacterium HT-58-2]|nr:hypothetical protein BZZ01_03785 [Nostocales cyanobacterium HT-58-2]
MLRPDPVAIPSSLDDEISGRLKQHKRPALKIEPKTTQSRSSIIFIVPCEQKLMESLAKVPFAIGRQQTTGKTWEC